MDKTNNGCERFLWTVDGNHFDGGLCGQQEGEPKEIKVGLFFIFLLLFFFIISFKAIEHAVSRASLTGIENNCRFFLRFKIDC